MPALKDLVSGQYSGRNGYDRRSSKRLLSEVSVTLGNYDRIMVVTKDELLQRFHELINGQTLWSGCLTMTFVKAIYETEDFNVFDRDQLLRRLIEEWEQAHVDILIPPNPERKPYLVVSLDHPADHFAFADDKEQAILLYAANMRAGYPSRIVDTKTGESLTK